MSIDIYAADEQHDERIDLEAWVALANGALSDEGRARPGRGLFDLPRRTGHRGAESAVHGKEGSTDVLSFPIDNEPEPSGRVPDAGGSGPGEPPLPEIPQLVGDIVICPAVAARNAVEHECSLDDELALLVVHGVLHLLGWDHAEDDEAERMEARERELLARHYKKLTS